jgi:hypothetical protein
MPPTLTSRKVVRAQLKSLLKAGVETIFDIDGWTLAAYESEPKDFGGQSPALTVNSDGSMTDFTDYAREWHRFWVALYWKRDDADTVEDAIDDLSVAVRQTLIDNCEVAGYWQDLEFDAEFSEMAYVLVDGVQYRSERLRVTVFSVCDNA